MDVVVIDGAQQHPATGGQADDRQQVLAQALRCTVGLLQRIEHRLVCALQQHLLHPPHAILALLKRRDHHHHRRDDSIAVRSFTLLTGCMGCG